jgi:hypothetical protein
MAGTTGKSLNVNDLIFQTVEDGSKEQNPILHRGHSFDRVKDQVNEHLL